MTTNNEAYTRDRKKKIAPPIPNRLVVLLTEARWILIASLFGYLLIIFLTFSKADPGWSHAAEVMKIHNLGGRFGAFIVRLIFLYFWLVGDGGSVLPYSVLFGGIIVC